LNSSHTFALGLPPSASIESGRSCCCVIRRMPETTRNSGATFSASVAQRPPFLRTAISRISGAPPSIPNRIRSSAPFSPSHVTVSVLSAALALNPEAAL